jgi:hypothetical protein
MTETREEMISRLLDELIEERRIKLLERELNNLGEEEY